MDWGLRCPRGWGSLGGFGFDKSQHEWLEVSTHTSIEYILMATTPSMDTVVVVVELSVSFH
jgi:hypothetical protein